MRNRLMLHYTMHYCLTAVLNRSRSEATIDQFIGSVVVIPLRPSKVFHGKSHPHPLPKMSSQLRRLPWSYAFSPSSVGTITPFPPPSAGTKNHRRSDHLSRLSSISCGTGWLRCRSLWIAWSARECDRCRSLSIVKSP